jgi:ribonuclease T1
VLSAGGGRHVPGVQKLGSALVLAAGLLAGTAQARNLATELETVTLAQLPDEARATESLIRRGGPFPYAKDGTVFGNRERLLPPFKRGYYREYTVKTPGARNRGARRIVCGGVPQTQPQACYYTADHYASFKRIVQ